MYLKSPDAGVTSVTVAGILVEADEQGLFHFESREMAAELIRFPHCFKEVDPNNLPEEMVVVPKSSLKPAAPAEDDNDPFSGYTKDDLKDYLDKHEISYDRKASKPELLSACETQYLVLEAAAEKAAAEQKEKDDAAAALAAHIKSLGGTV